MLGITVWDNTFHCRERDIVLRISITIMQTVQMRVGVWLSAQCSDRGVSGLLHFLLLVTHTINTAIPVSVSTYYGNYSFEQVCVYSKSNLCLRKGLNHT